MNILFPWMLRPAGFRHQRLVSERGQIYWSSDIFFFLSLHFHDLRPFELQKRLMAPCTFCAFCDHSRIHQSISLKWTRCFDVTSNCCPGLYSDNTIPLTISQWKKVLYILYIYKHAWLVELCVLSPPKIYLSGLGGKCWVDSHSGCEI